MLDLFKKNFKQEKISKTRWKIIHLLKTKQKCLTKKQKFHKYGSLVIRLPQMKNELLPLIKEHTDTSIEQTKICPQEALEFEMNKQKQILHLILGLIYLKKVNGF